MRITEEKLVALSERAAQKIDRYLATRAPKTIKQVKADIGNIIAAELRKTFAENSSGPLEPSAGLLIKLGSIIVHFEEMLSPTGHAFDRAALDTVLHDAEVQNWRKQMDKLALLPVKR